jgi:hypothetical protein|tara:strand:+ start:594 stop:881 length:288 start_codon:yes stop_codon:yes gene_type:complete
LTGHPARAARERLVQNRQKYGRVDMGILENNEEDEQELLTCYRKFSLGLQQATLDTFRWLSSGHVKQPAKASVISENTPLAKNDAPDVGNSSLDS